MDERIKFKTYKKDYDYSYMIGAFGTVELIKSSPGLVRAVYIHSRYQEKQYLETLCKNAEIPVCFDDAFITKISLKDNTLVLAVFNKFKRDLRPDEPHIVLVNPTDMGNLGSIMRTAAGCNIRNLAIILPSADVWHPKTIRASMGALFKLNVQFFEQFEEYQRVFSNHRYFPFVLDGGAYLDMRNVPQTRRFSLIFGNEACGLDDRFGFVGSRIKLPQTGAVDSYNLSVAVGIGAFVFAKGNNLI